MQTPRRNSQKREGREEGKEGEWTDLALVPAVVVVGEGESLKWGRRRVEPVQSTGTTRGGSSGRRRREGGGGGGGGGADGEWGGGGGPSLWREGGREGREGGRKRGYA